MSGSPWSASAQGSRLLSNDKISEEIERLSTRKDAELGLSNERILHRVAEVPFSDNEETRDCLRALHILCRTRGLYRLQPDDQEDEQVSIVLNIGGRNVLEEAEGENDDSELSASGTAADRS